MTAIDAPLGYPPDAVTKGLISSEIATVLQAHGIEPTVRVELFDCPEAAEVIRMLPGAPTVEVHATMEPVLAAARRRELVAIMGHVRSIGPFLRGLHSDSSTAGVLVYDPDGHDSNSSALRAQGAMDVVAELKPDHLGPLLRRVVDFRALLLLELDHRCEAKRLSQRELELLGEPPDQMSDDLDVFQPPPLPVGPLSTYNLEEASEAFETAYIGRVQQLCSSAREAAQVLGVSPATLSRRQKRETE